MAKQHKHNEAESLATALGLSFRDVVVRGETVRVEELEIEQLPQLLDLIRGLFEKAKGGSLVTMVHAGVPDDQADALDDGWKENYWDPWKAYLGER